MVKLLLHINPVELIEKVKTRPAIWDRKDKNHKNSEILAKHWSEISIEMNEPEQHVKRRWKGLRDQYSKELRRLTHNVFSDKNKKKPVWRYFQYLHFLKAQVSGTKPSRNIKNSKLSVNGWINLDDEDNNDDEDYDDSVNGNNDGDDYDDYHLENELNVNPIEINPVESIDCNTETLTTPTLSDNDDDKAFFISLLPHVRKISPAKKLQCQIEIQKVIHKHLCGDSNSPR